MNTEKIKSILQMHDLQCNTIEKSDTGFINEVYLTERYAIKLYAENNKSGFQKELWFYKNANAFYAPKLIVYGDGYIVIERIYGAGLYRLWRDMNDCGRKNAIEKIAEIIRHINAVDYSNTKDIFAFEPDFKTKALTTLESRLSELAKSEAIPSELAKEVRDYIIASAVFLDDEKLYLTYADLHFDNLLMTDDGRLYLIDYEMLEIAPKDYVLDVWQRMLIHPFTYANEDDHELTVAKDYGYIISWLKEFASDIFSHRYVKERVNIYCLLYELNILRSYPMADLVIDRIKKYLCGVKW